MADSGGVAAANSIANRQLLALENCLSDPPLPVRRLTNHDPPSKLIVAKTVAFLGRTLQRSAWEIDRFPGLWGRSSGWRLMDKP